MGLMKSIKVCKYCGLETSMTGICNGFNCQYAGEKTETIEKQTYDVLATNKKEKTCPACKVTLPALDNYFHRSGSGYFDYCHSCAKQQTKDWRKEYNQRGRTYKGFK